MTYFPRATWNKRNFYPAAPGFKRPGTSEDAAAAMRPKAKTLRDRALEAFEDAGAAGLTADQVADQMQCSILSIRPRVSELIAAGKIIKTLQRRRNQSGLMANVYNIEKGV